MAYDIGQNRGVGKKLAIMLLKAYFKQSAQEFRVPARKILLRRKVFMPIQKCKNGALTFITQNVAVKMQHLDGLTRSFRKSLYRAALIKF